MSASLSTNSGVNTSLSVRDRVCTVDIELLSVSVRPFYLPREFPQIFVTVVYINPKANTKNAVTTIHKVTQKLESLFPDAPCLILRDNNHCVMEINEQLLSVKGANKSVALPPVSPSDHNTILLIPI